MTSSFVVDVGRPNSPQIVKKDSSDENPEEVSSNPVAGLLDDFWPGCSPHSTDNLFQNP